VISIGIYLCAFKKSDKGPAAAMSTLATSCYFSDQQLMNTSSSAIKHPVQLPLKPAVIARCFNKHVMMRYPSQAAQRQILSTSPSTSHRRSVAVFASSSASQTVETSMHTLPDGMRLEKLRMPSSTGPTNKPPLLMIHGSYHAAWCWKENFMPFFSAAGYDTIAISVRGQGGSDRGDLKVSGDLESHADDLASVISSLTSSPPPILIGHSFGGLLVEKYASQLGSRPKIAGVALLCAVPPSGNKDIVVRITKKSLKDSFFITIAFIFRTFAKSLDACRTTFFSEDIPLEDLKRYQAELAAASPVRLLDLGSLNKVLPLPPLPSAAAGLPAFVAGGENDMVVDPPAITETAEYFGVKQPTMWSNMAHDCMLDTRWREAAESLKIWLDGTEFSSSSSSSSSS
jgi:pimeloyl-ACP methyl ester carboxylesterase